MAPAAKACSACRSAAAARIWRGGSIGSGPVCWRYDFGRAEAFPMRHIRTTLVAIGAVCGFVATSVLMAAGPTFRADYRFTGTALTAFKPLGNADWKVQNGEIVGTPKDAGGGWLLVNGKEFQDLQIFANVKCSAGCKAGFLMRAEKTPDGGMKGILMSLTEGD